MKAADLYMMLLVTALLVIGGAREIVHRNAWLGLIMIAIPTAGWVAFAFGR